MSRSSASRSSSSPAGRPSTIATRPGPCDSPAVVKRKAVMSAIGYRRVAEDFWSPWLPQLFSQRRRRASRPAAPRDRSRSPARARPGGRGSRGRRSTVAPAASAAPSSALGALAVDHVDDDLAGGEAGRRERQLLEGVLAAEADRGGVDDQVVVGLVGIVDRPRRRARRRAPRRAPGCGSRPPPRAPSPTSAQTAARAAPPRPEHQRAGVQRRRPQRRQQAAGVGVVGRDPRLGVRAAAAPYALCRPLRLQTAYGPKLSVLAAPICARRLARHRRQRQRRLLVRDGHVGAGEPRARHLRQLRGRGPSGATSIAS